MRSIPTRTLASILAVALVAVVIPAFAVGSDRAAGTPWASRASSRAGLPAKVRGAATSRAGVSPAAADWADSWETTDDLITGATTITVGATQTHTFWPVGDTDWFKFTASKGTTYRIRARGTGATPTPDPYVSIGDLTYEYLACDDESLDSLDSNLYWSAPATATFYFVVEDYWAGVRGWPGGGEYVVELSEAGTPPAGVPARVAGSDRYSTAAAVGKRANGGTWAGVRTVIVASGLDGSASDPLAVGGLAGVVKAPILLVNQYSPTRTLPGATYSAIRAIRAANPGRRLKFYLVGGTTACPGWVQTRLAAVAPGSTFERLSGIDRYYTAARIAGEIRSLRATVPTACLIANGESPGFFFDALAAAPIAYRMGYPILLTKKYSMPLVTRNEASRYAERYIVGNTYEVAYSAVPATRIGTTASGYSRTWVARRVAEYAESRGWLGRRYFCVTNRLPDALTGGVLAGASGGPMMFSYTAVSAGEHTRDWAVQCRPGIAGYAIIGGLASVGAQVDLDLRPAVGYWTGVWW